MNTEPINIRASLLDTVQDDLTGPSGPLGDHHKVLPRVPSRWYLTGFLVPTDADEDQRYDPNSDDEVDKDPAVATVDENQTPEQAASKRSYQPIQAPQRRNGDTVLQTHLTSPATSKAAYTKLSRRSNTS